MSLDDRLRGAYGRQLDDVRRRVGEGDRRPPIGPPRPPIATRVVAVAAALLVMGVGGVAVVRLTGRSASPTITGPAASDPGTEHRPDEGGAGAALDADDAAIITVEPGTGSTSTVTTSTSTPPISSASSVPAPEEEPPTTDPVAETGRGVANDVCPSGARAPLERATTAYVGEAKGWGRKDDLIDEQDGPSYFQAWEPGYEESVEVEIVLEQTVLANELRVAQDPFTPVTGTITVTIDGVSAGIELDGTGGWRVLRFPEPIAIDRFQVRRDRAEANIMEILICVDPPPGP